MESLGLLVFVLFCGVFLCGPFALGCAYLRWNWLAVLIGCVALMLGIFWFATVFTWFKWLGVISAFMGFLALLKATGDMLYDS